MTLTQRHLILALFTFGLVLLLLQPLRMLIALALGWGNIDLSHILLIPFISAGLIYWNRDKIFKFVRCSPVLAIVAFMIAAAFYYAGRISVSTLDRNDYLGLMTASFVASWLGGFLLVYGSAAFRAGLFPLLFLILAVPMPHQVIEGIMHFLQRGSADLVSVMFGITQTPYYRSDMVFSLPTVAIEVAEACSGIRSTIGMFIVTLLASYLLLQSNWRRTALLVAVIPISLFKNAVRIVTLTLLAVHYDMGFLTGSLHHEGGILFMLGGLALMYPILLLLMKSDTKNLESGVRS